MTWQPVTQPPQEVGLVRYSDESRQVEFMAQWDGRQFRHASGLLIGTAMAPFKGDVWKPVEESHVSV